MKLLKKDTSRVGYKLVGVTVPPRVYAYLCLYCLATGTPKAKLFKELIMDWIDIQKDKQPDSKLLQRILRRIQGQLNLLRRTQPDFDIVKFKEEAEQELVDKGLLSTYIDLVIKELE